MVMVRLEVGGRTDAPAHYQVDEQLFAGEYPGNGIGWGLSLLQVRRRVRALEESGVSVFLDLTEAGEQLAYAKELASGSVHVRVPVRDCTVASPAQVVTALNHIDEHRAAGRAVYVHCWGGVGRTGTIVGCWLVRHGMDGQAALRRVQELYLPTVRPYRSTYQSPEFASQQQRVREWGPGR
jgi:hypothetical protein